MPHVLAGGRKSLGTQKWMWRGLEILSHCIKQCLAGVSLGGVGFLNMSAAGMGQNFLIRVSGGLELKFSQSLEGHLLPQIRVVLISGTFIHALAW